MVKNAKVVKESEKCLEKVLLYASVQRLENLNWHQDTVRVGQLQKFRKPSLVRPCLFKLIKVKATKFLSLCPCMAVFTPNA